jgi:hypothetical protein
MHYGYATLQKNSILASMIFDVSTEKVVCTEYFPLRKQKVLNFCTIWKEEDIQDEIHASSVCCIPRYKNDFPCKQHLHNLISSKSSERLQDENYHLLLLYDSKSWCFNFLVNRVASRVNGAYMKLATKAMIWYDLCTL